MIVHLLLAHLLLVASITLGELERAWFVGGESGVQWQLRVLRIEGLE
jgi:hypothetical protein